MANNYSAVFKIEDLQKKLLFTLVIILIFRLGIFIPISGLDLAELAKKFSGNGLLGFVNLFSGGGFKNFSIFALGIIPYINASIIMQLLTVLYPSLKEMQEEGESGRKKVQQYTRYLTILIATIQSIGITVGLKGLILPGTNFIPFFIFAVVALVAGSSMVMWLGELITEKGLGNGASILIFVGIIGAMPAYISRTVSIVVDGGTHIGAVLILIAALLVVMVGIVIVQEAQRNIPVQYAKRVVGRKLYGGQNTYLPMKINQGGVIPIIFASSVLSVPMMVIQFIPSLSFLSAWIGYGTIFYFVAFAGLIFFFTFFYTAITFNPQEIADNIKKYGGFILGIRPGKPTAEYLDKVTSRLAFVGASFLAIISIFPMLVANLTKVTTFQGLGGTALLIMVGVAIDIIRQIESILLANKYDKLVR